MNNTFSNNSVGHIDRNTFINLLDTAITSGEFRFVRRAALAWLAQYPGDLHVSFFHACALVANQQTSPAHTLLLRLINKDPEFTIAADLAARLEQEDNVQPAAWVLAHCFALGSSIDPASSLPDWGYALHEARVFLAKGLLDKAEERLVDCLAARPQTPLAALTHLQILEKRLPPGVTIQNVAMRKIAAFYSTAWPECIPIQLYYVDALMDAGDEEGGVAALHSLVSEDIAGQVITRLWGNKHPYLDIWPRSIKGRMEAPIPAGLAMRMGWNQLSEGPTHPDKARESQPAQCFSQQIPPLAWHTEVPKTRLQEETTHTIPGEMVQQGIQETLLSTQEELDKIADRLNQPELTRTEGLFPIYVTLSTAAGLSNQYGNDACEQIRSALERVVLSIKDHKKNWGAALLFADDPQSTAQFGLKPTRPTDAWGIKRLLVDLDAVLRQRGEMIGALLIVGGPQIVPFHHLPNPVDDLDADIPSDNPYGTRDENYFIGEWPVGRLPGDASSNPKFLLAAIEEIISINIGPSEKVSWLKKWLHRFYEWISRSRYPSTQAFGFTAAIWKNAARSVLQPVGGYGTLLVSPPATFKEFNTRLKQRCGWGYFNLHGIPDSAEWYGHNDPTDPSSGPDYPVAIRSRDLRNNSQVFQMVFSEACYGAHLCKKTVEESIALSFLASGVRAFVGSTTTSYGSVTTPLVAADYLGQSFWKLLKQGVTVGEALRRAKISLIHEMHERQGYLDGEDQKTLISFVLYGDPLAKPFVARGNPKEVLRPVELPEIMTVCDRLEDHLPEIVPEQVLENINRMVRHYLPGMKDADLCISRVHTQCSGNGHECPTAQIGAKRTLSSPVERRVVLLSKQIHQPDHTHHQYARLTLDSTGKMIKLSVSR